MWIRQRHIVSECLFFSHLLTKHHYLSPPSSWTMPGIPPSLCGGENWWPGGGMDPLSATPRIGFIQSGMVSSSNIPPYLEVVHEPEVNHTLNLTNLRIQLLNGNVTAPKIEIPVVLPLLVLHSLTWSPKFPFALVVSRHPQHKKWAQPENEDEKKIRTT